MSDPSEPVAGGDAADGDAAPSPGALIDDGTDTAGSEGDGRSDAERPYLSIGEVLEVLKSEFDGVSIAQVRELESRGLFTPERTASGYRKFYDADLGLIRSLLERHGSSLSRPVRSRRTVEGAAAVPAAASVGAAAAGVARRPAPERESEHDSRQSHPTAPGEGLPGDPERRHPAAAARRARAEAALASLSSGAGADRSPAARSSAERSATRAAATAGPPNAATQNAATQNDQAIGAGSGRSTGVAAAAPGSGVADRANGRPLSLVPPPQRAGQQVVGGVMADVGGADPAEHATEHTTEHTMLRALAGGASGVSMSIAELCSASGLTPEQAHELEAQGLLKGRTVFSETFFDEDGLLIAHLARKFLAFGIEARHLRMFRLTAEREAAFYEQLVTPLLRRRNPDSRREALTALDQLLDLGRELRAVTVRQVIRSSIER